MCPPEGRDLHAGQQVKRAGLFLQGAPGRRMAGNCVVIRKGQHTERMGSGVIYQLRHSQFAVGMGRMVVQLRT